MAHATASPCGRVIAHIKDQQLLVYILPETDTARGAKIVSLQLTKQMQQDLLPNVRTIAWSHNTGFTSLLPANSEASLHPDAAQCWLTLATQHRVVVLQLEVPDLYIKHSSTPIKTFTVADFVFPGAFGEITACDFAFNCDSVLVLFDLAPHASILSLSKARRDDIANRKFSTSQGYAIIRPTGHTRNKEGAVLAVLTREKYADMVVVMERGKVVSSFKPDTIDAQSIMWSPDEKPVLAMVDAAAYGTNVKFTSVYGHPLRMLNLGPESSIPSGLKLDFSGTGVSAVDWIKPVSSFTTTTFAIGDGSRQVLLRSQNSNSMAVKTFAYHHPLRLESSRTEIWEHVGPDSYEAVRSWDFDQHDAAEVQLLAIRPDGGGFASKVEDCPNVVFIWTTRQAQPVAAIIFQKEVRQLLWDKWSSTLAITVTDAAASFHYWHGSGSPRQIFFPHLKHYSSKRWQAEWIWRLDARPSNILQPPLVMSSKNHFDVMAASKPESTSFMSLLDRGSSTPTEASFLDTDSIRSDNNGPDGTSIFF